MSHVARMQTLPVTLPTFTNGRNADFFCESFGEQTLKDPSQPPAFSMTSKLLISHGEANSYCFTASNVPEGILIILSSFTVIFLRFYRL